MRHEVDINACANKMQAQYTRASETSLIQNPVESLIPIQVIRATVTSENPILVLLIGLVVYSIDIIRKGLETGRFHTN